MPAIISILEDYRDVSDERHVQTVALLTSGIAITSIRPSSGRETGKAM
jgi:hypothetical protein